MMNRLKSFAHTLSRLRSPTRTRTRLATIGLVAVALVTGASCDGLFGDHEPIYFMGKVLDDETNQPLEGAFVLALYVSHRPGPHGTVTSCVKTKGMTTGKDGQFRFQVEKRNGTSPEQVYAIKPDYYTVGHARMPDSIWQKQTQESYADRHVYLKRQDPKEPSLFAGSFFGCDSPSKRADIEAAITYLEIYEAEGKKYFPLYENTSARKSINAMRGAAAENESKTPR
jgi:hypothetical protein